MVLVNKMKAGDTSLSSPRLLPLLAISFFVITGFGLVILQHATFLGFEKQLEKKIENERGRMAIGEILVNDLQYVNTIFFKMIIERESANQQILEQNTIETLAEAHAALNILQHGGTLSRRVRVNLLDKDTVTTTINYLPLTSQLYTLEILEIRPELIELENNIKTLAAITADRNRHFVTREYPLTSLKQEGAKIWRFAKRIDPLFQRVMENAEKLSYRARQELVILQNEVEQQRNNYVQLEILITLSTTVVVLFLIWIIFRQVGSIRVSLEEKVAELQESKRKLDSSNRRFSHIFDGLDEVVFVVDAAKRTILYTNRFSREQFNMHPGGFCWNSLMAKPDSPCRQCVIFQQNFSFSDVGDVLVVECEHGALTRELHAQMIEWEQDSKAILVIALDITKRRLAEQERDQINRQLQDAQMNRLKSIGILAGGIAHDFNNLLTGILGSLSLAQEEVGKEHKAYPRLQGAYKASLRAKGLTGKLLTFSTGGEPVRNMEELPELLRESASFVLSGSNVHCEFVIPDDLWVAEMDRTQISQVIQNLIVNADQAMEHGGIIRISCSNRKFDTPLNGLPPGDYVEITVTDNGPGITPDNLKKIFDPYFTTKDRTSSEGCGLGLSIIHSITEKHDGRILVSSEMGTGTTFTLYLPALPGKTHKRREKDSGIQIGSGCILVMDDEQMILDIAGGMLSHLGYQPAYAAHGAEAIALYQEQLDKGTPFDAVIMDLTIPGGMGGRECVKTLLGIDPAARVIVSSGYSTDPILHNYRELGFCGIIKKPYQLSEFSAALHEVLHS